jgi:hypothetical protein
MDSMSSTEPFITPQPPVPTMRIVDKDQASGFVIINKADFDKAEMVDFDAPKSRRAAGNDGDKSDATASTPTP